MADEDTKVDQWRITWGGQSWSLAGFDGSTAVTGAHVLRVTMELGTDTWESMNPALSPKVLMTWLAVLIADGGDADELVAAYIEVTSATAADLVRALTFGDPAKVDASMNGTG